jgi:molybdopterin-guanine dinucleotide biosynthesis protein A
VNDTTEQFSCIILAGGEGKRAGGRDKGLIQYKNKPLIEHVIATVNKQCRDIVISANRNIESYKQLADKVISDTAAEYRGPLAGIAACLPHCQHERVLIVACDMPELPDALVARLAADSDNYPVSIATVNDHHQLAMLINRDLLASIQQNLDRDQLKLISWVQSVTFKSVSFDDLAGAFANMNQL